MGRTRTCHPLTGLRLSSWATQTRNETAGMVPVLPALPPPPSGWCCWDLRAPRPRGGQLRLPLTTSSNTGCGAHCPAQVPRNLWVVPMTVASSLWSTSHTTSRPGLFPLAVDLTTKVCSGGQRGNLPGGAWAALCQMLTSDLQRLSHESGSALTPGTYWHRPSEGAGVCPRYWVLKMGRWR